MLDEMTARDMDTEGMSRKGSIFGGEMGLFSGLADVNEDDSTDFGDTFLGDITGFDGKIGIEDRPGFLGNWFGERRTATDDTTTPTTPPATTDDTPTTAAPDAPSSPSNDGNGNNGNHDGNDNTDGRGGFR
jgi:hypothetical protein